LWKECSGAEEQVELSPKALAVYEYLRAKGAVFFDDIVKGTMQFDSQCEESLAELVSYGLVSSDSFNGLRALLVPAKYKLLSSKKNNPFTMDMAGRWTEITHSVPSEKDSKRNLEFIAKVLLKRYGVVFRKLAEQESVTAPWRDLVRVYRSLEAKGEIRGGRFVDGVWGEQFALPETITQLREIRRKGIQNKFVAISACDPLNLVGIITPGKKVASYLGNRILFRDGIPVATIESEEVKFLMDCDKSIQWEWQEMLIKRKASPILRAYLGKYLA
jgi:ATP-dependent Lhr-like helicase